MAKVNSYMKTMARKMMDENSDLGQVTGSNHHEVFSKMTHAYLKGKGIQVGDWTPEFKPAQAMKQYMEGQVPERPGFLSENARKVKESWSSPAGAFSQIAGAAGSGILNAIPTAAAGFAAGGPGGAALGAAGGFAKGAGTTLALNSLPEVSDRVGSFIWEQATGAPSQQMLSDTIAGRATPRQESMTNAMLEEEEASRDPFRGYVNPSLYGERGQAHIKANPQKYPTAPNDLLNRAIQVRGPRDDLTSAIVSSAIQMSTDPINLAQGAWDWARGKRAAGTQLAKPISEPAIVPVGNVAETLTKKPLTTSPASVPENMPLAGRPIKPMGAVSAEPYQPKDASNWADPYTTDHNVLMQAIAKDRAQSVDAPIPLNQDADLNGDMNHLFPNPSDPMAFLEDRPRFGYEATGPYGGLHPKPPASLNYPRENKFLPTEPGPINVDSQNFNAFEEALSPRYGSLLEAYQAQRAAKSQQLTEQKRAQQERTQVNFNPLQEVSDPLVNEQRLADRRLWLGEEPPMGQGLNLNTEVVDPFSDPLLAETPDWLLQQPGVVPKETLPTSTKSVQPISAPEGTQLNQATVNSALEAKPVKTKSKRKSKASEPAVVDVTKGHTAEIDRIQAQLNQMRAEERQGQQQPQTDLSKALEPKSQHRNPEDIKKDIAKAKEEYAQIPETDDVAKKDGAKKVGRLNTELAKAESALAKKKETKDQQVAPSPPPKLPGMRSSFFGLGEAFEAGRRLYYDAKKFRAEHNRNLFAEGIRGLVNEAWKSRTLDPNKLQENLSQLEVIADQAPARDRPIDDIMAEIYRELVPDPSAIVASGQMYAVRPKIKTRQQEAAKMILDAIGGEIPSRVTISEGDVQTARISAELNRHTELISQIQRHMENGGTVSDNLIASVIKQGIALDRVLEQHLAEMGKKAVTAEIELPVEQSNQTKRKDHLRIAMEKAEEKWRMVNRKKIESPEHKRFYELYSTRVDLPEYKEFIRLQEQNPNDPRLPKLNAAIEKHESQIQATEALRQADELYRKDIDITYEAYREAEAKYLNAKDKKGMIRDTDTSDSAVAVLTEQIRAEHRKLMDVLFREYERRNAAERAVEGNVQRVPEVPPIEMEAQSKFDPEAEIFREELNYGDREIDSLLQDYERNKRSDIQAVSRPEIAKLTTKEQEFRFDPEAEIAGEADARRQAELKNQDLIREMITYYERRKNAEMLNEAGIQQPPRERPLEPIESPKFDSEAEIKGEFIAESTHLTKLLQKKAKEAFDVFYKSPEQKAHDKAISEWSDSPEHQKLEDAKILWHETPEFQDFMKSAETSLASKITTEKRIIAEQTDLGKEVKRLKELDEQSESYRNMQAMKKLLYEGPLHQEVVRTRNAAYLSEHGSTQENTRYRQAIDQLLSDLQGAKIQPQDISPPKPKTFMSMGGAGEAINARERLQYELAKRAAQQNVVTAAEGVAKVADRNKVGWLRDGWEALKRSISQMRAEGAFGEVTEAQTPLGRSIERAFTQLNHRVVRVSKAVESYEKSFELSLQDPSNPLRHVLGKVDKPTGNAVVASMWLGKPMTAEALAFCQRVAEKLKEIPFEAGDAIGRGLQIAYKKGYSSTRTVQMLQKLPEAAPLLPLIQQGMGVGELRVAYELNKGEQFSALTPQQVDGVRTFSEVSKRTLFDTLVAGNIITRESADRIQSMRDAGVGLELGLGLNQRQLLRALVQSAGIGGTKQRPFQMRTKKDSGIASPEVYVQYQQEMRGLLKSMMDSGLLEEREGRLYFRGARPTGLAARTNWIDEIGMHTHQGYEADVLRSQPTNPQQLAEMLVKKGGVSYEYAERLALEIFTPEGGEIRLGQKAQTLGSLLKKSNLGVAARSLLNEILDPHFALTRNIAELRGAQEKYRWLNEAAAMTDQGPEPPISTKYRNNRWGEAYIKLNDTNSPLHGRWMSPDMYGAYQVAMGIDKSPVWGAGTLKGVLSFVKIMSNPVSWGNEFVGSGMIMYHYTGKSPVRMIEDFPEALRAMSGKVKHEVNGIDVAKEFYEQGLSDGSGKDVVGMEELAREIETRFDGKKVINPNSFSAVNKTFLEAMASDVARPVTRAVGKAMGKVARGYGSITDAYRYQMFKMLLEQGMDPKLAAQRVAYVFVGHGSYSKFARVMAGRAIEHAPTAANPKDVRNKKAMQWAGAFFGAPFSGFDTMTGTRQLATMLADPKAMERVGFTPEETRAISHRMIGTHVGTMAMVGGAIITAANQLGISVRKLVEENPDAGLSAFMNFSVPYVGADGQIYWINLNNWSPEFGALRSISTMVNWLGSTAGVSGKKYRPKTALPVAGVVGPLWSALTGWKATENSYVPLDTIQERLNEVYTGYLPAWVPGIPGLTSPLGAGLKQALLHSGGTKMRTLASAWYGESRYSKKYKPSTWGEVLASMFLSIRSTQVNERAKKLQDAYELIDIAKAKKVNMWRQRGASVEYLHSIDREYEGYKAMARELSMSQKLDAAVAGGVDMLLTGKQ